MVEPEIAFADAQFGMDLAEDLLKNVAQEVLKNTEKELAFLSEKHNLDLPLRINNFVKMKFTRLNYQTALEMLEKEKQNFKNQNIE